MIIGNFQNLLIMQSVKCLFYEILVEYPSILFSCEVCGDGHVDVGVGTITIVNGAASMDLSVSHLPSIDLSYSGKQY